MKTNLRSWHAWVSIVLCLPIVLVAATAILIAHDDGLGTKNVALGSLSEANRGPAGHDYELKSYAELPGGELLYGTKYGLIAAAPGQTPAAVDAIGAAEVRGLSWVDGQVFAATKAGLWRRSAEGEWLRVAHGDFWSVSASASSIHAVSKEKGLLKSADGGATFAPVAIAAESLALFAQANGGAPFTLNKLIMDIHTGKLFFGQRYEWIWIDLVGLVMLFLTISGLVVWRRSQVRKVALQGEAGAGRVHA
jgi:hypothetical protein